MALVVSKISFGRISIDVLRSKKMTNLAFFYAKQRMETGPFYAHLQIKLINIFY